MDRGRAPSDLSHLILFCEPKSSLQPVALAPFEDLFPLQAADHDAWCDVETVSDSAPSVITFPAKDCPSKLVTFQTASPEALGTVASVEPIPSPS